jgi:methyl-accepting chemotaxis protein
MNTETLLTIFVGLTAFALLVQAIVLLVFFLKIRKIIASVQTDVQELRTAATPIITKSRELLERVAPKLDAVTTDLAEMARELRHQGAEVQATVGDILDRVHRQSSRIDSMFTSAVDGVEHASNVVADTVSKPLRQASAIMAAAKAFLNVMTSGRRLSRPARIATDQDMFV